jgi:hypothetical protein
VVKTDEAMCGVLEAMEVQGYVMPNRQELPVTKGCIVKIKPRMVQENEYFNAAIATISSIRTFYFIVPYYIFGRLK